MFGLTLIAIMAVGAVASWAESDERRLMKLAAGFGLSVILAVAWGLSTGSLYRITQANVPDSDQEDVRPLP